MSLKDAVKINSECFFTYELKDDQGDGTGFYKDPLRKQDIQSRTILGIQYTPQNTTIVNFKNKGQMILEMKKAKYSFKESDLSEETKKELDKAKISYEAIEIKKL